MASNHRHAQLEDAFERIEDIILPCIAMMLDSLLEASAELGETNAKALAAELRTLASELEALTQAVEQTSVRDETLQPLRAALA